MGEVRATATHSHATRTAPHLCRASHRLWLRPRFQPQASSAGMSGAWLQPLPPAHTHTGDGRGHVRVTIARPDASRRGVYSTTCYRMQTHDMEKLAAERQRLYPYHYLPARVSACYGLTITMPAPSSYSPGPVRNSPVWVSHTATRTCRKAVPFTDVKSTMANNNMALSKRPRNIPTHNETVCASIAAARAPQAFPCTIDDMTCLHTTL